MLSSGYGQSLGTGMAGTHALLLEFGNAVDLAGQMLSSILSREDPCHSSHQLQLLSTRVAMEKGRCSQPCMP